MTSRKRIFIAFTVLAAVFWIGTIGYMVLGDNVTFLDAAYEVVITLSTVGYKEVIHATPIVKIWTMLVITFGFFAAMVAVGSVTGLFVEGELGRMIGGRKLESRIKHLSNHVIICGFGRMGRRLAMLLAESKTPFVIIEKNQTKAPQIEELRQLYLVGDAADEETLRHAGIDRAKALVAVLTSDADNVFVTLSAHQMRPDLNIVARASMPASESKLRHAGASRVISMQNIGAQRIANVLTRPHLVDFVDVAAQGVDLEMGEFLVAADSSIAGKNLLESNIRQTTNVMVVAIKRGDGTTCFNPGAQEIIRPGDQLITIGPSGAVAQLERMDISTDEPNSMT